MNKFFSLFLILIAFYIFWLPGYRVSTDLHAGSRTIQLVNMFPWSWKEVGVADGLGEYYAPALWSQPMHIFLGTLALVGINSDIQTKLFGLTIIVIGFFGMWRLLGFYKVEKSGKSIGSIFFILNSYFLLLFDGGQLSIALSYSSLPLILFYFFRSIENNKLKDKLKLVFWILLLSTFDIRIVYLLVILFLLFYIFQALTNFRQAIPLLKNLLMTGFLTLVFLVGLHAYWLLPTTFSESIKLPQTYNRSSQVEFLSFSSITHTLFLQQPHWYKNMFGHISSPQIEFLFIPMLVFLAPFLNRKNKIVGFWLMIAIIGIFLAKGSNAPIPQVYSFIFKYIPGFAFFRDPAKFYFLIALSYSVLISLTCQKFAKINNKTNWLIMIYLLFLIRPIYLGQMTGLFSQPKLQTEYTKLTEKISKDPLFSRIFWIPVKPPLAFESDIHPGVEASRMVQKRPFAIGTKGSYETFNFLREAPYMGEIFDISAVGYIVYPFLDPSRDDLSYDNIKYYYTFLDQLSKRPWLSKVEDSPIPIFKSNQSQDRFFVTPNTWFVIGSDSLMSESTKSAGLKLSKNALIFAEEYPGLSNMIDELPKSQIVLNNKTNLDLAANFINSSNLIFPAKNLDFDPNQSGWWKREGIDLIKWREFLKDKYEIDNQDFDLGGGWAVGEGRLSLKVHHKNFTGNKVLLARVLESTRSGQLSFYQGDKLVGKINTKRERTNIRWFEVGKLESSEDLTINSEGDINVVNALSALDVKLWQNYKDKTIEYERSNRIVKFEDSFTKIQSAEVKYKQINPTKYIVTISNLSEPSLLIFSQNYDSLWNLNDKPSLPVYSLLNGFKIDKDGRYVVEFKAQKFVYPGLIIFGLTLGVLVISLLIL